MKIIVTGGAGFIGSHLCDRLLNDGHKVICIDNLLSGNKKNITHLANNPHFQFIDHDCILPLPVNIEAQAIFHFASPASPPKYQAYPIETLLVNTIGTYYLLEAARKWSARFIYASTSEIYGDPKQHPQTEQYWGNVNPVGPRSCYDEAKRAGESYVATYIRKYGLDGRIVRIFNTYGPRMNLDDGRVVTNIIKQILSREPIKIYGTGEQTRSFCYISDMVDGIIKVFDTPQLKGEIFNLGKTEEITILKLSKIIQKIARHQEQIQHLDLPEDDPHRRNPDITKAKKILHWQPKISLEQGLTLTYKYFKKQD